MATVDATKIHQGPGSLWLKVPTPVTGKRLLIDTNGNPTSPGWAASTAFALGQEIVDSNGNIERATVAGTSGASAPLWPMTLNSTVIDGGVTWQMTAAGANLFAGAVENAATVSVAPKLEEISADQIAAPIDAVLTAEAEFIEITLLESDLAKLQNYIVNGTFATGTDAGLPSGAQNYEEIAFGGLLAVPKASVAVISPRRNEPGKFVVSQLYQAYQAEAVALPFQRAKQTAYKLKFSGLADPTRPAGDQVGKIYRQT